MASIIYASVILFALLHHGMAYTIWGSFEDRDNILNKTLDIYKSVNKNVKTPNFEVESSLLARELSSFLQQVQGMQVDFRDVPSTRIAEVINIIVNRNHNSSLEKAEQEVGKNRRLFVNEYSWFLLNNITSHEVQKMIREALELDNDHSMEHSKVMSDFFQLYLENYNELSSYQKTFRTKSEFVSALLRYNTKNEWQAFMMMTTAYKLRSLQSNDDNYIKEFERLSKQLKEKLDIHILKHFEVLISI
uniref:Venom protein Vem37 n=1 Tax=Chelonus inanitus TaxID=49201 RepID=E6ZCL6_9HYME|nr:venom protein Vem37 [Chelonus inanitus]